jgi:lipoprotein NlpI
MKLQVFISAMILAGGISVGICRADALNDKAGGIAASQRGDYDEALDLFTRALSARGLTARDSGDLLVLRGFAYEQQGQYARAISDYGSILYLNPLAAQVYFRRAIAYRENRQYDRALADLDAAMRGAHPPSNLPFIFGERGVVHFALGRPTDAAQDFERVVALDPADQYGALWRHIALGRGGAPDQKALARDAARARGDQWPRPLLLLYLGGATPAQVWAAAAEGDDDAQQDQHCEAAFFVGEYELLRGDVAAARPLLQQVSDTCAPILSVHAGATGELSRIGD